MRRRSKYLFIGMLTCFYSFQVKSKERIPEGVPITDRFSWTEHRKLAWSDFKGPVAAPDEASAAATCCSIGFSLDNDPDGQPQVTVYNSFYINRSWVKEDARIGSILAHEQGHFDLCELYTRKLRSLVGTIDLGSASVKEELMKTYADLSNEYEARQQAYERETSHGTNLAEQRRWQEMITAELGSGESEMAIRRS